MANANKWYDIIPVQAADAAIPSGYHIAPVIIAVNPGDRTRISWYDVGTPASPLGDDVVGLTIGLLSGAVRHNRYGDPEDETPATGIDGTESVAFSPDNITITTGWGEEFECVGSEPALLQIYAYVSEEDGIVPGVDPDAET